MSAVEKSQKVDYRQREQTQVSYRYLRVNPDTPSGFAAGLGLTRASFTLPSVPFNDSRIKVNYDVILPAEGGTAVSRVFSNTSFIDSLKYTSNAGGPPIVQMDELGVYCRAVNAMLAKNIDFQRADSNLGTGALASVNDNGARLCPNRVAPGPPAAQASAVVPFKPIGSRIAYTSAGVYTVEDCNEINEPRVVQQGFGNAVWSMSDSIELNQLVPLSALSNDRTTHCSADRTLELQFNAYNKVGFKTDDATTFATATALTGYTIANLHLMVPVETNDELSQAIQDKSRSSGMRILTPRITHTKDSSTAATNFSTGNKKITVGDGHSLLAVLSIVQSQLDIGVQNYNITNLTPSTGAIGSKLVSFQSRLDSQPLSDSRLICASMDDFRQIKDKLEDSAISSARVWNYNRCFFDSWVEDKTCNWKESFATYKQGKDLKKKDLNYSMDGTTPTSSAYIHMWIITQGELVYNPNGSVEIL